MRNLALLILAIAGCGACVSPAPAEMLILLREESNQLRFWSNLLAGHHNIVELPVRDRSASAQILVEPGEGPLRLVRQFRVESWDEVAGPRGPLQTGFAVELEPTRVADRYRLRFEVRRARDGRVVQEHFVLRRGIGMFYLSKGESGDGATEQTIARAKSLVEMMLEYPQVYRDLEQAAQECSLPGLQFVPETRYSPTVIEAVMGEPIELTGPAVPDAWPQWVAALDADEYAERRAALDALIAAGPDVARYLRSLPAEDLSPEQRAQIAYVLKSHTIELPAAPQPLAPEDLRDLQESPPDEWLARVLMSSDRRVRSWATGRLARRGIAVPALEPEADFAERKRVSDLVRQHLSGQSE
ncbi:MAG: hypothetical protein K1X74_12920 [Pirellulales bacterium]|nr:hypothetical protein [Pirellulales bacterium]